MSHFHPDTITVVILSTQMGYQVLKNSFKVALLTNKKKPFNSISKMPLPFL